MLVEQPEERMPTTPTSFDRWFETLPTTPAPTGPDPEIGEGTFNIWASNRKALLGVIRARATAGNPPTQFDEFLSVVDNDWFLTSSFGIVRTNSAAPVIDDTIAYIKTRFNVTTFLGARYNVTWSTPNPATTPADPPAALHGVRILEVRNRNVGDTGNGTLRGRIYRDTAPDGTTMEVWVVSDSYAPPTETNEVLVLALAPPSNTANNISPALEAPSGGNVPPPVTPELTTFKNFLTQAVADFANAKMAKATYQITPKV